MIHFLYPFSSYSDTFAVNTYEGRNNNWMIKQSYSITGKGMSAP